jgi:hypothetical protein
MSARPAFRLSTQAKDPLASWTELHDHRLAQWMRKNAKQGNKPCPGECGRPISRTAALCLSCATKAAAEDGAGPDFPARRHICE